MLFALDLVLILGIVISLVLILVGAAVGFVYWKKKRQTSSSSNVDLSGLINKNFDLSN